jgi:4-cresol dehydrogenase (hydroxylating)
MTTTDTAVEWADEFVAVLGSANVLSGDDLHLADYADPFAFGDQLPPVAVVRPASVEEVQAILAIARRYRLPLWTVSRGRNLAYGGAQARVSGSVVCDLGRMDAVISVDEESAVAIVEPGVSFQALDAHLRAMGSHLAVSVPDLSWGSVLGNTLERGFSYTTNSEHQAMQCGMEVVLADGDVLRTGMGGLPGSEAWANYRGAFGPGFDGLFFQSNFGIVTKMGVWLRPRPEWAASCSISVPEDDQLATLIDTLRPLMLAGTIQSNAVIGNGLIAGSAATARAAFYDGPGLMPDAELRSMMDAFGLGAWNAQFGIYGSAAMVAARKTEIVSALKQIPGARIDFADYLGDVDPADVAPPDRTQIGIPSNEAIGMVAWRGGKPAHADVGFVCRPTGASAELVRSVVQPRIEAAGLDYAAGFMLWPRHIVALSLITFDRSVDEQRGVVGDLISSLIESAGQAGLGLYRAHVNHMDEAARQYSFNNHAALRFARRLKSVLDPDGILAPGKQGIWNAVDVAMPETEVPESPAG